MSATTGPVSRFQFGGFTVDLLTGELSKHGVRVRLQERPFQLLVALVEKPGEVVTRENCDSASGPTARLSISTTASAVR